MFIKRYSLVLSALMIASMSHAADFTVRVTNLTNGIYFTPLLVAAHADDARVFTSGQAASASLQAMAEGGDIAGLVADLTGLNATLAENPAGGLLAPTENTTANLNTDGTNNVRLSVVAMLLPTNDAFLGLNAITIPTDAGTYTYNVNAYDAGTEANDEIVNGGGAPGVLGIPAAPGGSGTGGTGAAGPDNNTTVHIHRNTLGDTDPVGGVSDLDARVHRWLNPVARVTVTVN
ncbi:MAG: hypothetical protein GKR90_23255 [Pseudomonadales bacterium]|nr:hypothetical protein [Pseudomonadales bacterium]